MGMGRPVRESRAAPHMKPMTTTSAAARPYSVTFDALYLYRALILGTDTVRAVDNGLTPDEMNELTRPDKRRTIAWIDKLTSVFVVAFGVIFMAVGAVYFFDHSGRSPLAAAGFILGLAATAGFFWAHIHGGQIRRETRASLGRLTASGKLACWSDVEPAVRSDLTRVARALEHLQEQSGTAHDSKAREAVDAVLNRNVHHPSSKHLLIAESSATDTDSSVIREGTLAAKATWGRDVARAEHLVQELEYAAGQKSAVV